MQTSVGSNFFGGIADDAERASAPEGVRERGRAACRRGTEAGRIDDLVTLLPRTSNALSMCSSALHGIWPRIERLGGRGWQRRRGGEAAEVRESQRKLLASIRAGSGGPA
jgi:hypothetical protein